ncbi:MAG: class I SAM-dependent methyltransferase [Casimicrobiaceae bacterium]
MAVPVEDDPRELVPISRGTLAHYEDRAASFWEGTRGHDVAQNLDALLSAVTCPPPFTILDFGCGPGRDLREFTRRGHVAIGLDGAASFAAMARAYSGCEVWQQDFLALDLPAARFDGIYANASLFHVPRIALARVLGELRNALRPAGVLFASNPHGHDDEGWNRGRYGFYATPETWRRIVGDAGFSLVDEYYRPAGLPREQQPWLATVWRRAD